MIDSLKVALIVIVFAQNALCQNLYSVVKVSRSSRQIKVLRKTTVPNKYVTPAYNAILLKTKEIKVSYIDDKTILQALIKETRPVPMDISGGYNYLRLISQNMRNVPEWSKINRSDGYNGVHHIINKSVLDKIYNSEKTIENGLTYQDFVRNSPSIFHPLHNAREFGELFHDKDKQLELYEIGGVKTIIDYYFIVINDLSRKYGLIPYSEDVMKSSLAEARFWSEIYGLKWE